MVCKLAYKLPLRRCECGGKPSLRWYGGSTWFVECNRITCYQRITKIYHNPILAVIKWNFKDWRISKERNGYLKGEK